MDSQYIEACFMYVDDTFILLKSLNRQVENIAT
jgi:hypothetical protein